MGVLKLTRKMLMIAITTIFVVPLLASAAAPLWNITPSTPLPQEVGKGELVTIKYTVTNQSSKPHTLEMKDIQGVTVTPASCALSKGQSCELTLVIDGAKLGPNGIAGGPVVCQQGNNNQCYQPSSVNQLKISPKAPPAPASTATPAPATTTQATTTGSTLSDDDALKELKALIEDLEIEIEDGTGSKPHSLTNTLLQFDPRIGEWHPHYEHELPRGQTTTAKDAPHAALVWLKRLVNSIEGYMISVKNPTNSESARSNISRSLQSQINKAASIVNAISPKTTTTAGQGGGGTPVGAQQAIDDATRRAMQTSIPSPAATPTPAPAKTCYKVGEVTMCH